MSSKILRRSELTQELRLPPTGLRFLIVVLLVLGLFFRFVNLDRKPYWGDETFTSLRIAGYTEAEFFQQVFNGRVISVEDLQKYQRLAPEKTVVDTVKSLAIEDSQHPPIYYVILRFWVKLFGNSVAAVRSLSVLFSLLVFPCLYWLCLELFDSPLVGWIAVALVAISPLHVLYAQEAREYSLWTATILLTSAALLSALRLKTKTSWGIYAATLGLGLYTFPFTGFVGIGHGIYTAIRERFHLTKTLVAYLLASLAALLAFAPWILAIINGRANLNKTLDWLNTKQPKLTLLKTWVKQVSLAFFDFNYDVVSNHSLLGPTIDLVKLAFLILVGYSLYILCRQTPKRIWLFVLTLISTPASVIMLPDLLLGGIRSSQARYFIPAYLGIQLAVAYLISTRIGYNSVKLHKKKLWHLVTIAIISLGVLSCTIGSQVTQHWSKSFTNSYPEVASIINQASRPLVISDDTGLVGRIMSLSYFLSQTVRLQLFFEPNKVNIADGFTDVFLFRPSNVLINEVKKKYNFKIEGLNETTEGLQPLLWKVAKL
jgi:uncharacterized membrane protein